MSRGILALVIACIGIAHVGCGNAGSGISVSGTVTRDGQPIPDARIVFVPTKDTLGPRVSEVITNGKYHIRADEGLQAGRYTIKISLGGVPHRPEMGSRNPEQRDESSSFDREVTCEVTRETRRIDPPL